MNYKERKAIIEQNQMKANTGDAQAAYAVAVLSLVEKDFDSLYCFCERAVEIDPTHHEALNLLALCYAHGLGTEKDLTKAFRTCLRASELGNDEAQVHLGLMYLKGEPIEKNCNEAKKWFEKAAEAGNNWGKFYLVLVKTVTDGVAVDLIVENSHLKANKKYRQGAFMVLDTDDMRSEFSSNDDYYEYFKETLEICKQNPTERNVADVMDLIIEGVVFYYKNDFIDDVELLKNTVIVEFLEFLENSNDARLIGNIKDTLYCIEIIDNGYKSKQTSTEIEKKESYMVISRAGGEKITLDNDVEYFAELDVDIKKALLTPTEEAVINALLAAHEGILFYSKQKDMEKSKLIYNCMQQLMAKDDTSNICILQYNMHLETTYGLARLGALEKKEGLDHLLKAVAYSEKMFDLFEDSADGFLKAQLIRQYRLVAEMFSICGDEENCEKYTELANKIES
jgi:tetratricopeptide (TPR) repeat protein